MCELMNFAFMSVFLLWIYEANCQNSAGWYSLFNICVWVSTKQTSPYTSCEEIGGRLLRWQDLDAGKKYLLKPPLTAAESRWYTVDGGDCCCTSGPCPAQCTRAVARVSDATWDDRHCNSNFHDFICESDPASIPTPVPPIIPMTTRIPITIFAQRTTTPVTSTTPAPSTKPATSTTLISTSTATATPTSTRPPSSDGTINEALPSTTMLQSTRSNSPNTEVTTSSQGRNVSESGTYAPQVADDDSTAVDDKNTYYNTASLDTSIAFQPPTNIVTQNVSADVTDIRITLSEKEGPDVDSGAAAALADVSYYNAAAMNDRTIVTSQPLTNAASESEYTSLATRPQQEPTIYTSITTKNYTASMAHT